MTTNVPTWSFENSTGHLNSTGKQRAKKPAHSSPAKKADDKAADHKENDLPEVDTIPAEATQSWKKFKEKYVGKIVFIKNDA